MSVILFSTFDTLKYTYTHTDMQRTVIIVDMKFILSRRHTVCLYSSRASKKVSKDDRTSHRVATDL